MRDRAGEVLGIVIGKWDKGRMRFIKVRGKRRIKGNNLFSHCSFHVGHTRHLCKGEPAKLEDDSNVFVLEHPSSRMSPTKSIQTERRSEDFTLFTITSAVDFWFTFLEDWQNPESIVIPNLFPSV